MSISRATTGDRVKAAAIALLVEAAFGYMLMSALGYHVPRVASEKLKLFGVAPPPPPPPPERTPPPRPAAHRPAAATAPPNLRAKATPVVAPTPLVRLVVPPPVIAAPVPEQGPAPSAGAADVLGPGTGAGGQGNGFGGGGRGDGDGDGGSRNETPPRQIGGRLSIRDVPPGLLQPGEHRVGVRYRVETNGRVSSCSVIASSGVPELDDLTCRLIEQRFRYRPSLDADGRPVASTVVDDQYFTTRYEDER